MRAEKSDGFSLLAPCESLVGVPLRGLVLVSAPQAAGAVVVVPTLLMAVLVLDTGVVSPGGSLVF